MQGRSPTRRFANALDQWQLFECAEICKQHEESVWWGGVSFVIGLLARIEEPNEITEPRRQELIEYVTNSKYREARRKRNLARAEAYLADKERVADDQRTGERTTETLGAA